MLLLSMCLFSLSIGSNDSNAAEVLAILKACDLISSNPLLSGRLIEIRSDSKTAVSWILNGGFGNLKLVKEIYEIRNHMSLMGGISLSQHNRATNTFADNLAKQGARLSGDFVEWSEWG
ncbi:hypothetical protein Q3G72_005601 [Acer saccharum]|nr:hypothetical protein Q3G72_005601 [Acer saccharum]